MTMVVAIDEVMRQLAQDQLSKVVPEVAGEYEKYFLSLSAFVMMSVADEVDSAAQHCLDENEALREILHSARTCPCSPSLLEDIQQALALKVGSIRISALTADNLVLRKLLIRLHEEVEQKLPAVWARKLNAAIWEELSNSSQRYHFSSLAALV